MPQSGLARERDAGSLASPGGSVNRAAARKTAIRLSMAAGLLSLVAMSEPSLDAALARLARVVARLERVESSPPAAPQPTSGLALAYAELDERHGLLRLRIQETIERLDSLIDREGKA